MEDPPNLKELIEELKNHVLAEKDLKSRTDDEFMIQCLRSRDYIVEKAFEVLKNYYKTKNNMPIENYKPSVYKWVFDHNVSGLLPIRNHDGAGIVLFRSEHWDPREITPELLFATNLMHLELAAKDEGIQKNGIIVLQDLKGFGWKHFKSLSPGMIHKMSTVLETNFPLKYKGAHCVNNPAIFNMVYAIAKPFLREPEKVHFHGSNYAASLTKHIDMKCLCKEIGGDAGPFDIKKAADEIVKMEDFFIENAEYGYNKS